MTLLTFDSLRARAATRANPGTGRDLGDRNTRHRAFSANFRLALIAAVLTVSTMAEAQLIGGGGPMTPAPTSSPPASQVPFAPPWTGAVPTTLQARGQYVICAGDFGAKCDGVTDDTAALQAALNALAPGVKLTFPAGTCLFSSPLSVGAISSYAIEGAGQVATSLVYEGSTTTVDLISINAPAAVGVTGVSLRNFRVGSNTTMTGGFALHMHGLFASVVQNVFAGGQDTSDAGTLCGGYWFDGAGGIDLLNPSAYSLQGCSDGIRVNAALGGTAELRIVGGGVSSAGPNGFTAGLHIAGGFGGVRCDETVISNTTNGVLIDNAVTATGNREFDEGATCALDGNQSNGILVNDPLASGGMIDIAGWIGSTSAGPGVRIEKMTGASIVLRGNAIYNNCGSGVEIDDASTYVRLDASETVNANGNSTFGSACTTYQSGHSGYGYGVEATVSTTNIWSTAAVWGNHVGSFNANTNTLNWWNQVEGATLWNQFGNAGLVLADGGGSSYSDSIYFQDGYGTNKWQIGMAYNAGTPQLTIWDSANSSIWLLACVTGGTCTIGESDASALTVIGSEMVKTAGASDDVTFALNNAAGGNNDMLAFEDAGVLKWRLAKTTGSPSSFVLQDATGSLTNWLVVSSGGSAVIGESNTNVLTINGAAKLTAYTVSGLGTAIPCNSGNAGALAYVTDATSPSWNATLSGGGSAKTLAMCNGSNWTAH